MLNLCNEQIVHHTYGTGLVKSVENGRITVEFERDIGKKAFFYPEAFERFLKMSSPAAQADAERDLNELLARLSAENAEKKRLYKEELVSLQAEKLTLRKPAKRPAAKKPKQLKTPKKVEELVEDN